MKKLFLIGYYGYDNMGDEVLLSSITRFLKEQGGIAIKVLSYNAHDTERVHGVEGVSRSKGLGLIKQILQTDILVSGGGSILQDGTSSKSLYYYMGILGLGKLLGKKVYLMGNGYGPVTHGYNRMMLKFLLKNVDGIVSRDQDAYEAFARYQPKRLFNGVDCVFLQRSDQTTHADKPSKRPYVVMSLRPWKNDLAILEAVSDTIDKLDRLGYDTVLVPMKQPDDSLFSRPLLEKGGHVSLLEHDIEALKQCLEHASFTIGMRLHALILSTIAHTPFIAVSYDPKVASFARQVDQKVGCTTESISSEKLSDAIDDMLMNLEKYRMLLNENLVDLSKTATEQMELLMTWINDCN
ncbi:MULTISPECIES: polysaccharide pyruvyl transferase CsaB [unclassified Fusibacter]|uniref:polysaccharide pyruvyl transferase CsaB n=1 Tax=unclassified Fusibacter TaxID=2624464 RepID=UPI0010124C08|nr:MULTISPECIES: polysaccharide pyruvyl transferase CsaB [unclassified Fusibacter]MCK8060549.1 polysaccharide pyruvyl transferase CsaB [Fusibacter sp. A2]NPE22997.1 polysaccharide pyruvyl transferase CsaB [Fusibacter sp. A1]RXV60062.1 polysaccharide pyruvyl transferase CsaB [Fusibacter sp. A1]